MDNNTALFLLLFSLLVFLSCNTLITRYFPQRICITLVVDRDCAIHTSWEKVLARLTRIIQETSSIFEIEFNIMFLVSEIQSREFLESNYRVEDYFADMHSAQKKFDSDISICVTPKNLWNISVYPTKNHSRIYREIAGYGHEAGAIIMRFFPSDEINVLVATHELTHLFFARHCTDDETSIMYPSIMYTGMTNSPPIPHTFDRNNRRLILLHKFHSFSKNFLPIEEFF